MGASSLVPPFEFVQMAGQGFQKDYWQIPVEYSACVLPCALFLGLRSIDHPGLCLVYGEPDDALSCLEKGATDYLREGWNLHELGARLYRLWSPRFEVNGLAISMQGVSLESGRASVDLTPAEASILRVLLAHRDRPVPAGILETASGRIGSTRRALAMQISRLRARLSRIDPELHDRILSCGGGAYSFRSGRDDPGSSRSQPPS